MIPALPFDVQRLIILQAAGSLGYHPDELWAARSRALALLDLSLVSKDWKDVVYPILYSSINYTTPKEPGLNKLSRTLNDSPQLGLLIRSLRVEGFRIQDFALVSNLRHFESLGYVFPEDETVETLKIKIKLWTLKVSHVWQGNWSCPCDGLACEALDDFERIVDPSELHTLVVDLTQADRFFDIPAFVVLPTVPLPSLTTLTIIHQLTFNNEYGTLAHFHSFFKRVGPTLVHLALHETSESDARPEGSAVPYDLFAALPNLVSLTFSGGAVAADDFEEGHSKLEEIIIGGRDEPFIPEGASDHEPAEPGWMEEEEARAVEMILVGVKAAEGGVNAYPRMKTIRMRCVLFDAEEDWFGAEEEEEDEYDEHYKGTVSALCAKVAALGWEMRDAKGRAWEEAGGDSDRAVRWS